jgi:cystathionine beta-lyase/cystathionine gamma-synthase
MRKWEGLDLSTIAAHGVRAPAPEALPTGLRGVPATEPLYLNTVMEFDSLEDSLRPLAGEGGYVYARHGMPNGRTFELTMAALEGGEDALATASGMAALGCAILSVAGAGDRVVLQRDAYGGTGALVATDFARLGISVEMVDAYDAAAVSRALAASPAKLLLVESISNPLVRETDVAALATMCRARGVTLVVDATFSTPVVARPLADGADVVMHSATKYLGGHHDLCAGVLVGKQDFIERARGVARRFGSVIAPMDAWLASRGLKTLAVRLERAQANARGLAERLRAHAKVAAVNYPGRGPLLSFDVGSGPAASRFVAGLELVALAPSLGGTATSLSHSATSSHRALTPEARRAIGVGDGLLRLSLGLEAEADLWKDFEQALERV